MLALDVRPRFIRELRRYKRLHGWSVEHDELLDLAVDRLMAGESLPPLMRDHPLHSDYGGFRDFHLDGDLVCIYRLTIDCVLLHRIGRHTDLFRSRRGRTRSAGP
ncbi:type II toxin-antitoxin system YafQ family toxin [Nevskia sp.]|uniref:type II toxin-antitoxin system YafQ family toxin n=1 Tax=Nevskia sp. TaxID=1929292 RepID=UPI0025CD0A24|nr:type II toxin-antitoxin system YafQ family toxin [Nevskia sp.]